MQKPEEALLVFLGHVGSPHGISGFFLLAGRGAALLSTPSHIRLQNSEASFTAFLEVENSKTIGDKSFLKIVGIDSPEAVQQIRNQRVWVNRSVLSESTSREVLVADLLGLPVIDQDGLAFGRVSQVYDFGAGPLLEIQKSDPLKPSEMKKILLPFINDYFPDAFSAGELLRLNRPSEDFMELWEICK